MSIVCPLSVALTIQVFDAATGRFLSSTFSTAGANVENQYAPFAATSAPGFAHICTGTCRRYLQELLADPLQQFLQRHEEECRR